MVRFLTDIPSGRHPMVLALGVFDAVHLGHRQIVGAAAALARKLGAAVGAVTFFPHPREVLFGAPPLLLLTREARIAQLREAGCDAVGMIDFTREFATMAPETFCRTLTREKDFRLAGVVVGRRWRFGAKASGDARALAEVFSGLGVESVAVEEETFRGEIISASRIRDAIGAGNLADARRMLGRPAALYGVVVHGFGDATDLLDAPTVNIELQAGVLPPDGVYCGRAVFASGEAYPAAINIGVAPTFDGRPRRIEAHLIGFRGDAYGEKLHLELLRFVREEKKFSSVAGLKRQIAADLEFCRREKE
ncbi:MAG: riboflavin biosynthesis protein RibF [Victivallaceae bacterium]|nr:riboflavin biosynthesis protein RibF [Victivallaceae bacterium]